mgnify:CR=1 FL=1
MDYLGSAIKVAASGLDADVPVTTDYRSVLAEVVAARTPASPAVVFPGFQRQRVGADHGVRRQYSTVGRLVPDRGIAGRSGTIRRAG